MHMAEKARTGTKKADEILDLGYLLNKINIPEVIMAM